MPATTCVAHLRTPASVAAPSPGLETRVMAQWRAANADEEFVSLLAFLRRATLGAGLVLGLSAAWSLTQADAGRGGDEAALLNYDIQSSLNP